MLIDTHAHLYWDSFKEDFDQVIKRSIKAGVTTIINSGVDIKLSQAAVELESEKIKFYSTIGIHPHDSVNYFSNSTESIHRDIERLKQIYQNNSAKVVAVGECGLDYLFDHAGLLPSPISKNQAKKLQRQLFQAQIDLAKKLKLPLIVHCREAWDEVLGMTKDWYGVYHCYSGLPHNTKYIIHNTNFLVSFAANITYPKNEYLRQAAKTLPLEKIILETDSPFLSPQSKRGQRNEPANVLEVAQLVADIKGVSLEEVAHQTSKNVKILFNLR
ncbi:TatD family hydrolase [Candidatus Daviesbacteria bacterium]|nr:TatD family hydrolase [Candidatus Daviesbacteria bacterium]